MAQWVGDRLDLPFDGVQELEVVTVGGSVNVAAGTAARVEADVLDGPEIEVTFSAGRLRIVHEAPKRLLGLVLGTVRADVSVVVPEGTPTTVSTVSADVFAAGLRAATTISTVSGRLTATGLDGHVVLKTISGDLEVQDVGGTVSATTVSGGLTVAAADPASVQAQSVSGDVTLDLRSVPRLRCTTVSGDVALRLPSGAGLQLDVSTVSGHLDTTFPTDAVDLGRRRMRGRIGGGGPEVSMRTTSGDVAVLRADPAEAQSLR